MKFWKNKWLVCMTVLLTWAGLCGFSLMPTTVALDCEKRIVYQHCSIEQLQNDFAKNAEKAKLQYNNQYIAVLGRLESIDEGKGKIVLSDEKASSGNRLEGSFNKQNNNGSVWGNPAPAVKDLVDAYGKLTVNPVNGSISLNVDMLQKVTDAEKLKNENLKTEYLMRSGAKADTQNMQKRMLKASDGKGEVKAEYYIPAGWSAVEYPIKANELGTIEGYLYRLNEIPGETSIKTEYLFVTYFDTDYYVGRPIGKAEIESVENTIVDNILKYGEDTGKLKNVKRKQVKSSYGAEYHYITNIIYSGSEKNKNADCHAEFVFQPVGTEGLVVYLYAYEEKKHIDDIMILMRLLKV